MTSSFITAAGYSSDQRGEARYARLIIKHTIIPFLSAAATPWRIWNQRKSSSDFYESDDLSWSFMSEHSDLQQKTVDSSLQTRPLMKKRNKGFSCWFFSHIWASNSARCVSIHLFDSHFNLQSDWSNRHCAASFIKPQMDVKLYFQIILKQK